MVFLCLAVQYLWQQTWEYVVRNSFNGPKSVKFLCRILCRYCSVDIVFTSGKSFILQKKLSARFFWLCYPSPQTHQKSLVVLLCANLAKLELCFPKVLSPYSSKLGLYPRVICMRFGSHKVYSSCYAWKLSAGPRGQGRSYTLLTCRLILLACGSSRLCSYFSSCPVSSVSSA